MKDDDGKDKKKNEGKIREEKRRKRNVFVYQLIL
jgi:hypothetical protein